MPRKNMHLGAKPEIFRLAYKLRANQTEAEKILWQYLKNRQIEGVKFRRQHPSNKFVGDFFANELKLIIELDGKYHDAPTQKFYDQDRTEILENYEFRFLRFRNNEVINNIDFVLGTIRTTIHKLREAKMKK